MQTPETHSESHILTGPEVMALYTSTLGKKKAETPALKLFLLGILAGVMIALSAVAAGMASHAADNPGTARMIAGFVFPFGLGMVMLMGAELFTGNSMIILSVLDKTAKLSGMLKNWLFVYIGNMVGSILVAAGIVWTGSLDLNGGKMGLYVIKTAVAKCSLSFGPAFVLGIFCNILVCLAVLCSLTAKDTTGRITGAYIPIVLFCIGGFEHCVANMYYIPAGIFAALNPSYASLAVEAGLDVAALNWGNMFFANLLPVTIGNILGGAAVAILLWECHLKIKKETKTTKGAYANHSMKHVATPKR